MSALADALVAAQRRALAALEKAYVHSPLTPEEIEAEKERVRAIMDAIGCTDTVEQSQLFASLDVIRATGAGLPAEPTNGTAPKGPEPATAAQLTLIQRLVEEKKAQHPDLPLNKAEAHEVIDTLKAGTYDYANACRLNHSRRSPVVPFGPVQYHHLVPRDMGGDDVADNIVPLCPTDHELVTRGNATALYRLRERLTDSERSYILGKLGEGGMERLFGVTRGER